MPKLPAGVGSGGTGGVVVVVGVLVVDVVVGRGRRGGRGASSAPSSWSVGSVVVVVGTVVVVVVGTVVVVVVGTVVVVVGSWSWSWGRMVVDVVDVVDLVGGRWRGGRQRRRAGGNRHRVGARGPVARPEVLPALRRERVLGLAGCRSAAGAPLDEGVHRDTAEPAAGRGVEPGALVAVAGRHHRIELGAGREHPEVRTAGLVEPVDADQTATSVPRRLVDHAGVDRVAEAQRGVVGLLPPGRVDRQVRSPG